MAEFTSFDAPAKVTGTISVNKATADSFGGGKGLIEAGKAISGFAGVLEQRAERSAGLHREETIADDRLFAATRLQELKDTLPNGGEGAFEILKGELEQRSQQNLEGMSTRRAKEDYGIQSKKLQSSYLAQAVGVEAQATAFAEKQSYKKVLSTAVNSVRANPTMQNMFENLEQVNRLVEDSRLTGKNKQKFHQEAIEDLYVAQANGILSPDNVTSEAEAAFALTRIEGEDFKNNLPKEAYAAVLGKAQRMVEHYGAKDEEEFVGDLAEKTAEIRAGVPGVDMNIDDIAAVKDEGTRKKLLKNFKSAQAVGAERRYIENISDTEIAIRRKELQRRVDTAGDGSFYDDRDKLAAHDAAVRDRNAEINKDRASYVVSHNPGVQGALDNYHQALQENEAGSSAQAIVARDNYVTEAMAANKRLGITNPYLLHTNEVTSIGTTVASVERTPEGAQKLKDTLSAQAAKWGKHWPMVYRQLVEQKAIGGGHVILARMSGDLSKNVASLNLANALSLTEKEMLSGKETSKGFETSLHNDIANAAKDFYTTLGWQGASKTVENHQDAIKKLSIYYMTQGNQLKQSDAIERAYEEIVGADYNFINTYRVPKDYDKERISRGASAFKKSLASEDLRLPADLRGGAMSKEQYAASLSSFGKFVTNSDESGLLLVDEHGRPVFKSDGRTPVTYSFVDIQERGGQAVEIMMNRGPSGRADTQPETAAEKKSTRRGRGPGSAK